MAQNTTLQAFPRPYGALDPATLLLYQQMLDRITTVPANTIVLSGAPVAGTLDLYKNGVRLDDPTEYTQDDRIVTLATSASPGDVFHARYYFRATRTV